MAAVDFAPNLLPRHMSAWQLLRRSLVQGTSNLPLYAALLALVVWGAAVAMWGLPALFLPAVAASPVLLATLVWISRG